ncbi:winged helix-turn-helix transcriptional regulator [Clostridium sp. Cult2]|uniref:winged helix-turn-helix transcriptional regulator n=1 Tax=Clostridium sp. Cult2 TaxID=2079003 RepID=UPI001F1B87D4
MININTIKKSNFFIPTPQLKELVILEYIEKNSDVTQKELARVANAAPSMINVYIEEYEQKGYMKREYISAKTVKYLITPKGVQRKNYLSISYLQELMKLYQLAKENVENFIQSIMDKGYENILLYGAGEVAETIIGVIRDKELSSLNVIAIVDDDKDKQGEAMLGYKVIAREEIKKYKHDAIVITSYTFEDAIVDRLKEMEYPMDRVKRFFSV